MSFSVEVDTEARTWVLGGSGPRGALRACVGKESSATGFSWTRPVRKVLLFRSFFYAGLRSFTESYVQKPYS